MNNILNIVRNSKKTDNEKIETINLIRNILNENYKDAAKNLGSLFKFYHVQIKQEKTNIDLIGILKLIINNNTGRTNNLNIILGYLIKKAKS